MLSDQHSNVVVSSLGWVDHGTLWVFRAATGDSENIPISRAKYLSIHAGSGDFFSVTHHFESDRVEITVHTFAEPGKVVARALLNAGEIGVTGDLSTWSNVQRSYVTFYRGPSWSAPCLVRVDPLAKRVELQQFAWFGDSYDKGYQGVIGVVEIPGQDLLIVSVQRDSHPVLYDPHSRNKVGQLNLAERLGNPTLFFRRMANELWADDYDTLVKIEPGSWRVTRSRRLQGEVAGTRLFIGHFSFDPEETICIAARPYSGDVVAISTRTLRTKFRCGMDGQPIEAALLSDRSVLARDWKSGRLLRGELRRTWGI